jgi:hypothetical protein
MKNQNTTVTTNNTIMEGTTMKNYKEMSWNEVVAYAKELGINPGHKKRVVIEEEIEDLIVKMFEKQIVIVNTQQDFITVPVGDMSTDKYYPALQTEEPVAVDAHVDTKALMEQKIKAAIKNASYNATYNNMAVVYINADSLNTIIKYNLPKHRRDDISIDKVITGLINANILYKCNSKKREIYGVKNI